MGLVRVLLALCVVEFHSIYAVGNASIWPLALPNGVHAVQAFYVISGFYMSLVLSDKYRGRPLAFYNARLLRLLPMYWLVAALTITFMIWFGAGIPKEYFEWPIGLWLWFSNLTLVGLDWNCFIAIDDKRLLSHLSIVSPAWTLGVELTFYLLAPWFEQFRSRWLFVLVIASVSARLITYRFGLYQDPWNYRFFPFELAWFLAGMLAHRVYVVTETLLSRRAKVLAGRGALALCLVAILAHPALYVRAGGVILLPVILLTLPFVFGLTKDNKIDQFIGEFSYPIYIGHFLVIAVTSWAGLGGNGWTLIIASVLLAALLLFITRPIERARAPRPAIA